MKGACAHPAVTNVSETDHSFLLHASGEQNACHHWNHVAEMRNGTNEPLLHIAKMNVEIASAGWSPRLGHVLRKDFPRTNSFDEDSAEIADDRSQKILWLKCI